MTYTALQVVERDIASLRPHARNARTHSKKQIKQIAASIERFGFTNPVLVSDDGEIIAGHGRVEAAKLINWRTMPTLALSHLSEAERRAYVLADNKLALNAGWDREILARFPTRRAGCSRRARSLLRSARRPSVPTQKSLRLGARTGARHRGLPSQFQRRLVAAVVRAAAGGRLRHRA